MTEPIHHLGRGYEPHVIEVDGQLLYSIPVDSGSIALEFTFELIPAALPILKKDNERFVALFLLLHTLLQDTFGMNLSSAGVKPRVFMQQEFDMLVYEIVLSSKADYTLVLAQYSAINKVALEILIEQEVCRRIGNQYDQ